MNLKKFLNNVSGLQAFQLMRFSTLMLISIVLSKSSFSTFEIGKYEFFIMFASMVSSFWINGYIQSFLSVYKNNSHFDFHNRDKAFVNIFAILLAIGLLSAILVFAFSQPLSQKFYHSPNFPFLNHFLAFIILSTPSYLTEYIYLLKNKPTHIVYYGIISFGVQLLLVCVPIVLGQPMHVVLRGLVISAALRFVWLCFQLIKYKSNTLSFGFIKEHIKLGTPLVLSFLLAGSAPYIDGLLVMNYFDASEFTIFRYGAKELPLVILANALSAALISAFSDSSKNEALSQLKKKSIRLMHLMFPVAIVLLATSKFLYPIVFNPEFGRSAPIFNIYLLLVLCYLVFPQTIMQGMKRNKAVMYISFFEILINIGFSLLFINTWGIIGVAYATLIAFAFHKIACAAYVKFALNIPMKSYIPFNTYLIYAIIILIVYTFVTFL